MMKASLSELLLYSRWLQNKEYASPGLIDCKLVDKFIERDTVEKHINRS